jgi:segregation and condensation protein A
MDDYTVELPIFHGPLDLLLYLVKRNEVDVLDIPIATITDQYLAWLSQPGLGELDIDQAGEFVVMASTLMEIKSKMLLPQEDAPAEAAPAEDPRRELVRQLLEHRKFREAAARLEERAAGQAKRLARRPVEDPVAPGGPPPIRPAELWDLVSAFARLMRETLALAPRQIVVDETPQHVYAEQILARLAGAPRLGFAELFTPPHHRARLVGLFLALLELVKNRQVRAEQAELFGPIWLSRAEGETD